MGFFDGYNVSTSGMSAQRTRINTVSANIANAQTTHTQDGGPYKKQNVVFEEMLLNASNKNNTDKTQNNNSIPLSGVDVRSVVDNKSKPIMKYEPNHPDANKDGYVAYPNINPVVEMVDLIEAMRSYEANLASFETHKAIDNKTIDILKA
jgi:flagellar basal-body rod protein FlgC